MDMVSREALLVVVSLLIFAGCGSSAEVTDPKNMDEEKRIEWLLRKDLRFSNQMERRRENGVSEDRAVSYYVEQISGIDLEHLPRAVRSAYQGHRQAWESYYESLENAEVNMASSILGAIVRLKASGGADLAALGTMVSSLGESEVARAGRRVDKTWEKVRETASEGGASLQVSPFRYSDERLVSVAGIEVERGDWDPNLGGFGAPDIRLSLYLDGVPACFDEGKDSYTFSPSCSVLVRPSSEIRIRIVDDDINEPDPIGEWVGTGKQLSSIESFGKVRSIRLDSE